MTKQKNDLLHSFNCTCGKLLFKGLLSDSTIQIKCKKCGQLMSFQGYNDHDESDMYSLMLDRSGKIFSASSNIQRLFGYTLPELLLRNYAHLLPEVTGRADEIDFENLWSLQNKENYFFRSKMTHKRKNGEMIAGVAQSRFVTTTNGLCLFNEFYPDVSTVDTRRNQATSLLREYPFILQVSTGGICLDTSIPPRQSHDNPRHEIVGESFANLMLESTNDRQELVRMLRIGRPFDLIGKRFAYIGNAVARINTYFSPNFDQAGKCTDYSVYIFDTELLKSHERQFALNPRV
jgi:PAS domain S-box-containing protein